MIKGLFLAYVILSLVLAMVACGETPATEETAPTLSASTTEPLPSGFSALTLVDNEQFTVRISDIDPKGFWGYTLKVYLENKTDKELMFSTDNVSVNGFMCDPYWAVTVAPGKKANEDISFGEGDFERNNIQSVEQIEFTLCIYDSNDILAGNLLEQVFTVKP